MDEWMLEQAARLEEAERENARVKNREALAPQKHPGFNGHDCIDCEEPIPEARLAMGRIRCVECQSRREK